MMAEVPASAQAIIEPIFGTLKIGESKPQAIHVEDVVIAEPYIQAHEPRRSEGETAAATGGEEEEYFIGSIDQGTTSSRFLIFNSQGEPVANHQIEFENMYPESG
jgi:glycerol kinase